MPHTNAVFEGRVRLEGGGERLRTFLPLVAKPSISANVAITLSVSEKATFLISV